MPTPPAIAIERLGIEHAETVLAWVGRLLAELGEEGEDAGVLDVARVMAAWRAGVDRFHVFAARDGAGDLVGLLTLSETFAIYANGPYGVIDEMIVDPRHRSAGVGRRLLEAVKTYARSRGWRRLDVTAPESPRWARSRRFYEREGFTFTGPKLKYVLPGVLLALAIAAVPAAAAPPEPASGAGPAGAPASGPAVPGGALSGRRPVPKDAGGGTLVLAGYDLVDLTHPFDASTLYWPNAPSGFELKRLAYGRGEDGFFYSANAFSAPEHGGTHLDAPIHFSETGLTADALPLSRLVAMGCVLDVRAKAAADPDYRATPEDVLAFEKEHGRIRSGSIVILKTGWESRWPDRKAYFGDATPGDASHLHFPSFGAEAARLLVDGRSAAALGVDTASIDYGPSKDFPVHRIVAERNVPGLENLCGLETVPATGAVIVALPMKIAGGSGGPLRAIALVPRGAAKAPR